MALRSYVPRSLCLDRRRQSHCLETIAALFDGKTARNGQPPRMSASEQRAVHRLWKRKRCVLAWQDRRSHSAGLLGEPQLWVLGRKARGPRSYAGPRSTPVSRRRRTCSGRTRRSSDPTGRCRSLRCHRSRHRRGRSCSRSQCKPGRRSAGCSRSSCRYRQRSPDPTGKCRNLACHRSRHPSNRVRPSWVQVFCHAASGATLASAATATNLREGASAATAAMPPQPSLWVPQV